MKDGKIVVLQVLGGLNVGGAESRIMDILRNIDRDKIQYDFLLHSLGPDAYEEEAKSLGANIYRVPRFNLVNTPAYKKAMKAFFSSHPEIDIVQGHITSSASIYLPIAKKCGVKATIAHTRSAGVDKDLRGYLTLMLTKHLDKKCDYMWACSTEAAISVFGQDNYDKGLVRVIPNAIDVDKFACNKDDEIKKICDEYNLADKFVVGHVGRFNDVKNHTFLIDVFAEIAKLRDDAVLMMVGKGPLMDSIREKVKGLGLADKVIFTGGRSNVKDYYANMDVLVFPSKYEGLPGTIVEAQSSLVPCLISDVITKDVDVTGLVEYESLSAEAVKWAKDAIKLYDYTRDITIEQASQALKERGFDVTSQVGKLKRIYERLVM